MARLKLCSHCSCSRVVELGQKYCAYHQHKHMIEQRKKYREYQQRRLSDYNEAKLQAFYQSGDWERLKEAVKASCYHIDIFEYYLTGKIVEGETVHHILELREHWDSRLDINNMIYLTNKNHKLIHNKYNKGNKEKLKVQKILFGLIERFEKEFY